MGGLIERFQVAYVELLFQHETCKVVEESFGTSGPDHERFVVPQLHPHDAGQTQKGRREAPALIGADQNR